MNPSSPHDLHFTVQSADGTIQPQQHSPVMQSQLQQLPTDSTDSSYLSQQLKQSSHPTVLIFHVLFKGLAIATYLFGGIIFPTGSKNPQAGPHTIILTTLIIIFLAADFWTVKNISGRLLVGLRWWNQVTDNGTEWIFESATEQRTNGFDKRIFWTFLYVTPVVWSVLFLWCVIQFKWTWLLVNILGVVLSGANVYGYYKCSKEEKARFQQMVNVGAQQGALTLMRSSVLGALTGRNVV